MLNMRTEIEDIAQKLSTLIDRNEKQIVEDFEDGLIYIFGTKEEAFEWLNTDVNDNYDDLENLLEELVMITSKDIEGYDNVLHKLLADDDRIVFLDDVVVFVNE